MAQPIKFNNVPPELKISRNILPYLTFPLTKSCNFKCLYCGIGGETTASRVHAQEFERVIERVKIACSHGVSKFRLTGGEPFAHQQIGDFVRFFRSLNTYLLINTNASLIEKKRYVLQWGWPGLKFAASLDSLNEIKFNTASGTNGYFRDVIKGIRVLAESKHLLRLNMVVSKINIREVFHIIDFCREIGCNLKLLDIVSVPLPYGNRDEIYVPLNELELELERKADIIELHEYARHFGTPCKIYNIDGVNVTVKSTLHGSRYDIDGICSNCPYFPCHEGLYDVFALPDGRLCGCRWSITSVSRAGDFQNGLREMAAIFQRATWDKNSSDDMRPRPDFVMETGMYGDY